MQHLFLFLFLEPFRGGLAGVCWIIALLSCKMVHGSSWYQSTNQKEGRGHYHMSHQDEINNGKALEAQYDMDTVDTTLLWFLPRF